MLSSAQPVTATEPARLCESPEGVSITPKGGAAAAPVESRMSVTVIGPAAADVPVKVRVMAPVTTSDSGKLPSNFTPTVSGVDAPPEAGVTVSQGLFDVAVQVAADPMAWVRRTV